LEKNFKKDVDYVVEIFIPEVVGIKRGGDRKSETITMTIRTFKKFCMKARTDKADEIHDYYIKLEYLPIFL
jgi:phage anti-repressor protein